MARKVAKACSGRRSQAKPFASTKECKQSQAKANQGATDPGPRSGARRPDELPGGQLRPPRASEDDPPRPPPPPVPPPPVPPTPAATATGARRAVSPGVATPSAPGASAAASGASAAASGASAAARGAVTPAGVAAPSAARASAAASGASAAAARASAAAARASAAASGTSPAASGASPATARASRTTARVATAATPSSFRAHATAPRSGAAGATLVCVLGFDTGTWAYQDREPQQSEHGCRTDGHVLSLRLGKGTDADRRHASPSPAGVHCHPQP